MKDKSRPGEYKIGITADLNDRTRQVDKSVRGRVVTVVAYRRFFAQRIETKMHRIFAHRRFTKYGSGRTEWFKLNMMEYVIAKVVLWYLCNKLYFAFFICLVVIFGISLNP